MRCLACFLALPLLGPAQAPIRVDVNLVNVAFSVRDGRGNLIDNLTQDDFEVFEDGAPQKISFFARATDIPLDLGLVVDFSGSQDAFVKPHHTDLRAFLRSVFGPKDRAFLLCFGNRLRLASDFTNSAESLIGALDGFEKGRRMMPELGPRDEIREAGTAFYDRHLLFRHRKAG
jgi:Ca-activated chloride channel family protein